MVAILTNDGAVPNFQSVIETMRRTPGYATVDFEWVSEDADKYVFRTKYATFAVSLTPPQTDAERNIVPLSVLQSASRKAWHWAEAAFAVQGAKRQILALVLPEENELDSLDVALLLTCFASAVVKNVDAKAVFWSHASMLHEPNAFLEHAKELNRRAFPVELWVDFGILPNADKTISFGTYGLHAFGLEELEVVHSRREPKWVLHWLFNLAHFMIENGPIMEDEHTFGASQSEKFIVSVTDSSPEFMRKEGERVLKIEFSEQENQ